MMATLDDDSLCLSEQFYQFTTSKVRIVGFYRFYYVECML